MFYVMEELILGWALLFIYLKGFDGFGFMVSN